MTDLAQVLRHLPHFADSRLLVGNHPADDAAVFRLSEDLALVQTVDFFTPVVDDPFTYGQIAAANSLSDVYAMGGDPITAMNIAAFPMKTLSVDVISEILRGGAETASEAGISIVGGHTVDDEEPKYGLSVTGTVHPDRVITAHGGQPGDVVFLTKPLGTGVIATALKRGKAVDADVQQAVIWMTTLNRSASIAMRSTETHAATDVTGFGLLGHLAEMCDASGVSATIDAADVPFLPGALAYVRNDCIPTGTWTNLEHLRDRVMFAPHVPDELQTLLADPQTSGGLLVCVQPDKARTFVDASSADMLAIQIGTLQEGNVGTVNVRYGAIP